MPGCSVASYFRCQLEPGSPDKFSGFRYRSAMDLQLTSHTALVTGSHRGTGFIIAKTLAAEGARVLVHGFSQEQATRAAAEIAGSEAVWGDISSDAGSETLIAQLQGKEVDILINNYGTAEGGSWESSDSSDWLDLYEKNVLSAARLIRALLPELRSRSFARIINLGTVGSTRPNTRMPHYYAAKGALANMTTGLAGEVAGTAIRVNLVSPGLIATPEVEAAYVERGKAKGWGDTWAEVEPHIARDIPIRRIATREEIASAVCFLASPLSDAIHGHNLRIDGGALGIVS